MYCRNCGSQIADRAAICVHCGCPVQGGPGVNGDAPSFGMAVLGFFIPLAGLIIWAVNQNTKPLMAKSAGKGALIGFIVSTVFSIISSTLYGALISTLMYY